MKDYVHTCPFVSVHERYEEKHLDASVPAKAKIQDLVKKLYQTSFVINVQNVKEQKCIKAGGDSFQQYCLL